LLHIVLAFIYFLCACIKQTVFQENLFTQAPEIKIFLDFNEAIDVDVFSWQWYLLDQGCPTFFFVGPNGQFLKKLRARLTN